MNKDLNKKIQSIGVKNCLICELKLALGSSDGPGKKIQTYFDFVVSKEHAFIGNIFDKEDLENCTEIKTKENYHESFRLFLQLNMRYSKDIEDISDDCII